MQSLATLSNGVDGLLGDVLIVGDVESEKRGTALNQRDKTKICETATVGEGQTLDSGADGKRLHASIVDILGEVGKVEAADEVAVAKEGVLQT